MLRTRYQIREAYPFAHHLLLQYSQFWIVRNRYMWTLPHIKMRKLFPILNGETI